MSGTATVDAATRWEYKTYLLENSIVDCNGTELELCEFGEMGWELVSMYAAIEKDLVWAVFKRIKR